MNKTANATSQHGGPQRPPDWSASKATVGVMVMVVLISALLSWQALHASLLDSTPRPMWVTPILEAVIFIGSLPCALRAVHRARWRRATMWIGHKTALTVLIIPLVIALILIPLTTQSAAYGLAATGIAFAIILVWGYDKWRYSKGLAVDPFDPDAPLKQRKDELAAAIMQADAAKPALPYRRDALIRWFGPVTLAPKQRGTWRGIYAEAKRLWAAVQWLRTLALIAVATALGILTGTLLLSFATDHGPIQLIGVWHVIAWPIFILVLLPVALVMDVLATAHRRIRLDTLAKELAAEEQVAPATHSELQALAERVARASDETRHLIQKQASSIQALRTELRDRADLTPEPAPRGGQRKRSVQALSRSIKRPPRAAVPRLSVREHRRTSDRRSTRPRT